MTSDRQTWQLFADWCRAADLTVGDLDEHVVDEFLATCTGSESTRRRRSSTLRTGLARLGCPALPARPERPRPTAPNVATTLPGLPPYSWPTAVGGRRDACVVVLANLGLSRAQMRAVMAGDVAVVDQGVTVAAGGETRPVVRRGDPDECPACAISRWVRALAVLHRRGRGVLAERIDQPPAGRPFHDCLRPLAVDLDTASLLVVAVDQHGHVGHAAMTPRAISALLHRATRAGHRAPSTAPHSPHGPWLPPDLAMARLLDAVGRLDDVELEAERVAALARALAEGATSPR